MAKKKEKKKEPGGRKAIKGLNLKAVIAKSKTKLSMG